MRDSLRQDDNRTPANETVNLYAEGAFARRSPHRIREKLGDGLSSRVGTCSGRLLFGVLASFTNRTLRG